MLLFFFVWSGIGWCFLDFLISSSSSFDTSFFVFFVLLSKKKSREEFFVCVTRKTTPLVNCNNSIEFYISIAKKSSDPPKSR